MLFEIAKLGFTTYTSLLGTHDAMTRIYGSLGLLPVFLLWLYVLWIVVLLGVELAYVVEHRATLTESQRRRFVDPHVEHRHPDAVFAIAILNQILTLYRQEGPPPTAPDIADALGADPHGVHTVLGALVDARLLIEGEGQTYLPARPMERLTPGVAFRAWREVTAPVVFSERALAQLASVEEAVATALEAIDTEAGPGEAGSVT